MIRHTVLKTAEFKEWLESLTPKTKTIVLARLDMIAVGHFGDHKRFDGLLVRRAERRRHPKERSEQKGACQRAKDKPKREFRPDELAP